MMWKWSVVLGVLTGLGSVCCRVTVRPQNTVAIRGERTSLECRTADGSVVRIWSFVPSTNPKEVTIFTNWRSQQKILNQRFGVDVDGFGSGILYTNETQFSDGGKYTCSADVDERPAGFSAELIVLESNPVCSVRKYDNVIRTGCSIGFTGNWAPRMEWRHHSNRTEAHEDGALFTGIIAYNTNGTHVTSELSANIINSANDNLFVTCKIFFDARDKIFPNRSATNVPDFVRIWTSPVIGPTDKPIVPDVTASLTTPSLDVVSNTLSDQTTDVTRLPPSPDTESKNDWTIILIGAVIFAILVVFLLSAVMVCIIRKKKPNNQCRINVDAIYRGMTTTRASDSNIYDSILLCDENGYRIPQQDSNDADSPIESFCTGSLDPYYVTAVTKQSTENIGKSLLRMSEANAASTEYEKMSRLPNDKVDSTTVPKQQHFDSSKLSETSYVEAETEKASYYLQIICDSEEKQCGETGSSSSSSRHPSAISPSAAYTSLMF